MIKLTRRVLCLDWDKRSLRLVAARIGGGRMVLEDAHSHRLPAELDSDDPAAMGDFIQQMLRRHRLKAKLVVVDVPRERAVINRLTLPPTPEAEVAGAVRFQAMRELPFPLETAAADYVVTRRDEQGLVVEALLAAVTNETLDRVRATCAAAGLTPTRIGLRPYANLVSLRRVTDVGTGRVLFVDVGPGAAEIDVFSGDALAFARWAGVMVPLPAGDAGVREDSRIISLAELADVGAPPEAIAAAVDELLVEVTRTIQAWRATEPDAAIERAVIAGGTGIETQLAEALRKRLGLTVDLFDPTAALSVEPADGAKLRSFSAALGLAWGLGGEGLLALDFLNPKKPVSAREQMQRRVRIGVLAASAAALLLACTFGYSYWNLSRQRSKLVDANRKLAKEIDAQRAVQQKIEHANLWAVEPVWPEELLALTRAAVEPGKQMLVQGIELRSDDREQKIKLTGVHASNWGVLNEFVERLISGGGDGQGRYDAASGAWVEVSNAGTLSGKADITVDLLHVLEAQEQARQREKAGASRKPAGRSGS